MVVGVQYSPRLIWADHRSIGARRPTRDVLVGAECVPERGRVKVQCHLA